MDGSVLASFYLLSLQIILLGQVILCVCIDIGPLTGLV